MILNTDSMSVGMPPPSIIDKLQEYVDDNPEIEQFIKPEANEEES